MGTRTENLLLKDVRKLGYEGVRVDISSGGYNSPHDAGDLIVGRTMNLVKEGLLKPGVDLSSPVLSDLYVIEEKYRSSSSSLYIQERGEKVENMIGFAERIGATPVLAYRWSTNLKDLPEGVEATHYIVDARQVDRGDGKTFSVHPRDAGVEMEKTSSFFGT